MPVTTSQQIAHYYEQFQDVEVTFNKEVIKATLLNPKGVFLKCLGHQWPCIVYSTSFAEAKVIVSTRGSFNDLVRKANNLVSLRFSFHQGEKADPLSFFVSAKLVGYAPYGQNRPDIAFVSLTYTQRPPDDLIEIVGQLLDANSNAKRRREERIVLTVDSARKLGIRHKEAQVEIAGVPRRCIVRDLSFSGAKVIVLGIAKMLLDKDAVLQLQLTEPPESIKIPGKVIRLEPVEGRSDISAFAMHFDEDAVPVKYKLRINNYLRTQKKKPKPEGKHAASQ